MALIITKRYVINKLILSIAFLIFSTGCVSGNCRNQTDFKQVVTAETALPTPSAEKLKVYKEDGSLQCGMGKAVSLAEMQKQIADLKVYSSFNKNDAQMRIQVCGAPTGNCNVYEIDRSKLSEAQSKGFKEWVY